jgi:hypothetical protein
MRAKRRDAQKAEELFEIKKQMVLLPQKWGMQKCGKVGRVRMKRNEES